MIKGDDTAQLMLSGGPFRVPGLGVTLNPGLSSICRLRNCIVIISLGWGRGGGLINMDLKWAHLLVRPLSPSRGENSLHMVGRAS